MVENSFRQSCNPVLVEVTRGQTVESVHRGAIAVANGKGEIVAAIGDIAQAVFPRSAIKPIQALPLIETGAADRYGLSEAELALACASHTGEAKHTDPVAAWLDRIGLDQNALECGCHQPVDPDTNNALIRAGREACPLHNNCSGKHSGFISTARHLGEDHRGYVDIDHPVQRRVTEAMSDLTGFNFATAPWGVDGCSIPSFAAPLAALAAGMGRMADTSQLPAARAEAAKRIRNAMAQHPDLVGGSVRVDSAIMRPGLQVMTKGGAEGVHAAILPEKGLGIVLKINDGNNRAADVAIISVLQQLGVLNAAEMARLADKARPLIKNANGRSVGEIRPADFAL